MKRIGTTVAAPWPLLLCLVLTARYGAGAGELKAPDRLWECEGQGGSLCAVWTFTDQDGAAQWSNGAVANLVVQQYDPAWIIIRRDDPSGTSAGLSAVYVGKLDGDRIEGTVTWTWPRHWPRPVQGTWFATLHPPDGAAPRPHAPTDPQPPAPPAGAPAEPQSLPATIHWCAAHCLTLKWSGDHYTWGGKDISTAWTVTSFRPDAVVIERADYRPFPGRAHLTGRISPEGNRIVDGTITWTYHPCCGLGTGTFTAAWGSALDTVPGSDEERSRRLQPPPQQETAICASRKIQQAMNYLVEREKHSGGGMLMNLVAMALVGVNPATEVATLVDSKTGSDDGRYTGQDPGSFICMGIFVHGSLDTVVDRNADPTARLTAETVQAILASHPPFYEWYKVKAQQDNTHYHITLLSTILPGSQELSTDFTFAAP